MEERKAAHACDRRVSPFSAGPCLPGEEGALQVHERQAEPHQEPDSNLRHHGEPWHDEIRDDFRAKGHIMHCLIPKSQRCAVLNALL